MHPGGAVGRLRFVSGPACNSYNHPIHYQYPHYGTYIYNDMYPDAHYPHWDDGQADVEYGDQNEEGY